MANSNKGRKFFATAATAALVASAIVPVASAAQVNDLNSVSDYAKEAVQDLVDRGVITGDEKGNFNPKASVKRSEAAKILAEALGYEADSSVTFPDVAANAWYAKYVAAVASEGLFAGDEKGNFNPEGTLTRSQAAKILVIALGLEGSADLSEFKDAKSAQSWAVDYLEIAVANGVLKGENGNLKPNDNITRQDFAVMFSRAELAADPLAQLEKLVEQVKDALADLVTDVTKENLKEAKAAAEAAEAVIAKAEAALEAADEAGLLTDDEVAAAKAGLELAKAKLETAKKAIAAAEAGEVTISSVSAINLTQIAISFSEKLDDTTAETKSNYTIDGVALASGDVVTLAADGKTVVITLAIPAANQSTKKVTVKNVKSLAGVTIEDFAGEVTFADFQAPVVESVVSAGPDSFKVTFSEPVDTTTAQTVANYTLNDGQYFIQSATKTGLKEVTVKVYSTLPEGTYTVGIKNVADLAGFKIADTKKSFTQVADTTAPAVASVVSASPEKVVLEFTEDISINDSTALVYHTNTGNTPDSVVVDPTNSKRLILTFTTHKLPQGGTAYLVISKDLVKDGWNNKNAQYTSNIAVTIDTVKPTVTKLESPTDKSFKLTFSEEVTSTTAQTIANYTILDGEGKKVTTAITSAVLSGTGNNVVTLTLASALSGGNYTVVVENVKDLAGNTIDKASNVATVKDTTAPTVKTDGVLYADKKIVKVEFSEAMATSGAGSVLDLANYQIGGTYLNTTKATVSVTDNGKAVLIDYSKTDLTLVAGNSVVVGKVADVTGNTTANFTSTVNLVAPSIVAIDSVKATGTKTVVVTLDDSLSKFNATDFVIKQGATIITPASVTFANVDGVGVITYTLTDTQVLNTAAKLKSDNASAVTVETATTTTSENAFGVKVGTSLAAVTADDKIVAVVNKYDHDANVATPDVDQVEVAYTDADFDGKIDKNEVATFYIHYSEGLDSATISKLGFEVAGFTVSAVGLDTDTSIVKITANANADNTAITANVKQVANIADVAGNVVAGGTTYTVAKETAASAAANTTALNALTALTSFTPLTFTQTGTVAGGNVQYATAANVLAALPTSINVTLGNGSIVAVPVTWADTDLYTATAAASYTFTATWGTLPSGSNNSGSLVAPTVEVVVAP
jgi:trimeric autotransporter adhesin